ncbi:SMI1 / KNR4 family protein [Acanthamoeba castellanii str. Neff]|uniref:SMI1 / KNR4 family protein n=1 Tax=Acanthamoeba castellanii (strain ATCC 30010 / Neff) TaxID=1257118 RepID=L8H4J8_ACACF|nr:SMI1 / KNR4 family protein [Acanthamoeba castellanii str. Neff]ELR20122.1 SMI1 / KNR4 family protein [Acanthamoeba castellanii str. Neff]
MATPEGFPELTFAASVPPPAGTAKTTVVPSALEGEGPRVITWQNYLWEEPKVASASDIQAAETKLNVTFPADYKAVVTEHQGQTATPAIFKFFSADSEAYDATSLSTLFHFVPEDADRAQYHVVAMHDLLKDRLPEGVIPIGDDPGGGYVAFDYRVVGKVEGATGPYVVFLDHEAEEDDEGKMKTIFLADSFTGFLGQLRTEDEIEAEMEAAELVGEEDDGEEEEEEDGEGEEEGEGEGEEGEEDDAHVAKKRRNEEGNEDVTADAGDNEADEDDEEDDEAAVGEKRKASE